MKVKFYMMLIVALLGCFCFKANAEVDDRWFWYNAQPEKYNSVQELCEQSGGTPNYPIHWGGAGWYGCWGNCKDSPRGPCFVRGDVKCPSGTNTNKALGECEKIDPPPPEPGIQYTPNGDCQSGVWDVKAKACVPIHNGCPDGQIKNDQGQCAPEPDCPEGETKSIGGVCRPECPSGNKRNATTGFCEPECSTNTDRTGQCNAEAPPPAEDASPNPQGNCGNSAGNPILIATGQKVELETDLSIDNSAIKLTRNYWSSRLEISSLGLGWQHNWRMLIQKFSDEGKYKLYRNKGTGITFTLKKNGQWVAPAGSDITMFSLANGGWKVIENGTIEIYNAQGQLISYDQPGYSLVTLAYNAVGQLTAVTDAAKNSLTFSYDTRGLMTNAASSQGLTVNYKYDEQYRLVSVTKNNKSIKYHYENTLYPNALTGITDERGVRNVTWTYNEKGQAISSENAGGANKYQLEFLSNDRTRVINPLGGATVYHFGNFLLKRDIVKVEGEAVGSCIASNAMYSRDYQGLIMNQEDKNGGSTSYEYNDRGLETKRTFNVQGPYIYYTVTTKWHDLFPLPVEINKAGWRTTFKYDDNGRLINKTTYSQ